MLHHVELHVSDLERAIAFWTPLMQRLGYAAQRWSDGVNYRPEAEGTYLCLLQAPEAHAAAGYHRRRIGLNHLAFEARSRGHVDELRRWAKESGHVLLYDDRYPYATAPGYYAVYLEDPDRIKIEVVAPPEA